VLQDQGMCGGCWSFSAAETTESAVAIATGKLLTFSEQELIDCAPNPNSCGGTGGCNGATQEVSRRVEAWGLHMRSASRGLITSVHFGYSSA
jgi:predicted transcriptional regulator of viral defense system